MKAAPFEYVRPTTLDDAIAALAADDNAKLIAGGQSLVPLMAMRLARPTLLVDVADLGLDTVAAENAELRIGATVTHRRLERDPSIGERMPLLSEAASYIGYPAVRVRGTIGGSLAHADPVAELPAVLLAAGGAVVAAGAGGRRVVPASALFDGFLTTTLEPDDIIVEVRVPIPARPHGAAFCEWSPREGDFAAAGIAVIVERDDGGRCAAVRAAACGMADTPVDCSEYFEGVLGLAEPSDALLRDVARRFGADDLHGLLAAKALFRACARSAVGVAA